LLDGPRDDFSTQAINCCEALVACFFCRENFPGEKYFDFFFLSRGSPIARF